jgi:O-Antigen ligase
MMNGSRNRISSRHSAILLGIAIALMVPVILFTVTGFQVCLTLVVAPLAALALLRAPSLLRNLFLASVATGAISIGLALWVLGDQFRVRYVLSLLLIMTPPLYFFLGWYLCARVVAFERLLMILGAVSAAFVSALAIEAVVTGSQVRWYTGSYGATVLNVDFLGLPIYGSYGVLSLVSLILVQMFVIGAAFIGATERWLRWGLLFGFGAAAFLLTGSNARSPQLVLPCLVGLLGLAALFGRPAIRGKAAVLLVVCLVATTYSVVRMVEPLRIVTTAKELLHIREGRPSDSTSSAKASSRSSSRRAILVPDTEAETEAPIDFESLSTGRQSLLQDALAEVKLSPIFGNGFASFGRLDPSVGARSALSGNRTAHVQYLTILWKGGLLFFLPYMALLIAFWLRAIRGLLGARREDVLLVSIGLIFLFTILSVSWDILLVPSAGALGFFLLGAVSESTRRTG